MTDGPWTLAKLTNQTETLFVRIRTDLVADPALPNLLAIEWTFIGKTDELVAFENLIVPMLETDRQALLAVVITRLGLRTWLFYCSDPSVIEARINAALGGDPSYPIRLSVEPDPTWSGYTSWLRDAGL